MQRNENFFGRKGWKTRLGFYFAIMCSSFGLVNIWRFPYVVIENGGGAFLYIYFVIAVIIGSCFVMAELLLGKIGQQSLWQAVNRWVRDHQALNPNMNFWQRTSFKVFNRVGEGTLFATVLVLAYYASISGWVLYYLFKNIVTIGLSGTEIPTTLDALQENFFTQLLFGILHLSICYFYVRRGINRGLERMAFIVVPVFLLLLGLLCYQSLSLPNAQESLRYLLYPDFSKINFYALNQAIGHMVLSLGLGLGTMITFGSYFHPTRDITSTGPKVVMFSMVISAISVLIICPMVLGATYAVFGPKLLFQTIPQLILKFDEGQYILTAFYLSLYLSSLVVTTGLLESLVANITDRLRWKRKNSLRISSMLVILFMIFPILATTSWRHYRWYGGVSLLQTVDGLLVNYFLPILALFVALTCLVIMPRKHVIHEFTAKEINHEIDHLFPLWKIAILWIAPLVIIASFVLRFF